MKYEMFIIILAVFEESHPLNTEIRKYDQFMKNFETTGRRLKQEISENTDGLSVVKRESVSKEIEGILNRAADEGVGEEVCTVRGETLNPGEHYLDYSTCEIWYCRRGLIRHAEIDEYTCQGIAESPEVYEVFFKECVANNCIQ